MIRPNKFKYRSRLWVSLVAVYIVCAFVWWAVLLYRKNHELHEQNLHVIKLESQLAQQRGQNTLDETQRRLQAAEDRWNRQRGMIVGEGLVLSLTLLAGLWAVANSYRREVRAAQMQRNFLLSITHELKSPLASIRLILDTFRRRPNLQPEQVTKLTQSAIIETERLQELVENLLLASRLEASYQPQPEDIRIDDMVRDIFEKIKIKYPRATFTLKSPEAVYLHADVAGIESVLSNLIENAAKYSGSDKPVTVRLIEKAKNLIIEVADEGIGISDEDKVLVFRRFYRAGNEDTRTTKGTGLGLYIVQEITQRHGGHVLVRDNQPRGTVFEVQFPISA